MLKTAVPLSDRILPVIDLKRGQVVHAVAGQRESYQPLRSQLIHSFHPGRVASAIREHLGTADVYVADLDAIEGGEPDWNSYASMQRSGAALWIDAGTRNVDAINRIVSRVPNLRRVIVGLESLVSLRDVEKLLEHFPSDRLVFSLDLRDGVPLTNDAGARRMSAESIAAYVIEEGMRSIIVLDLTSVGTASGAESTINLCRNIRARYLDVELTSGGGVRDLQDVEKFVAGGCDRVLVATALHQGKL